MAQFTLEVEVARDGITHVRARILMGLLMKCIGKPSNRHFAIAMEVLVRSYGSQEKWAEDISVVALTLFYLIREHPTRMYFPQIPLMLPKLVLPDEQSLVENYGSAFALSANRYMIYAENFFSVPIQTPLKQLEHIMPYPKCRQESKERVYAYINSQHHRMAIFFGQDITARQQWLDALKSLHLPDRLRIIHELPNKKTLRRRRAGLRRGQRQLTATSLTCVRELEQHAACYTSRRSRTPNRRNCGGALGSDGKQDIEKGYELVGRFIAKSLLPPPEMEARPFRQGAVAAPHQHPQHVTLSI
ncbi:hypothetical protein B0T10DRAFT_467192 [Thelonectria olida]|uniref:Uncharacterized protein n=1 Tax=Thelonectria olida TaxID=1576542 RepID=A0A9P8VS66_9HYPO|nr:hypothetical protein B0T10DRAFT_467192 [Thelonectria olida]